MCSYQNINQFFQMSYNNLGLILISLNNMENYYKEEKDFKNCNIFLESTL